MTITLGVRAHDFGTWPAEILAARIAACGLQCVQLAPAKALPGIAAEPGVLSPGLAGQVRAAFARHGVRIAVLGCYVNLVHPDREERRRLLARFKEHLRFDRDIGCSVVATETASLQADWSWHPDNAGEPAFQEALGSVRELVAEAEKFGVIVAIEGVATHIMSTPRHLQRMLEAIPSPNLQILFDPVNLLTPENAARHEAWLSSAWHLLGDRIVTAHAKDFVLEADRVRAVAAGQGRLNYELWLRLMGQRKPGLDVILEDTHPDTIDASIRYVRALADRVAPRP